MSARSETAGTLVLVVGPSGAGKDTLLAIARDLVAGEDRIAFPRRIITRDGSAAEQNDTIASDDFDAAAQRGAFAFWWGAHGLKYGIPATIEDDIRRGVTVVCNVSRLIVPQLRRRYARCRVVLVDAPREIRAARIAARKRAADGQAPARLDRIAATDQPLVADLVIENVDDPRAGGRALADMLLGAAERPRAELSAPSA